MNIRDKDKRFSEIPKPAENSTEMWSEMLAGLSHDMRTPLSSIKGYATTLLREDVSWSTETQREFLKIIVEEAEYLEKLIIKLLDSTTLSWKGEIELKKEQLFLSQVIAKVTNDPSYHNKQHAFTVLLPEVFPPVKADPILIERVLRNLVENAVKYSPAGTLIVIKGETTPEEVIISVADQGVGIDEEHLTRLFDKFFRVNNCVHEKHRGIGLGLPLARQIILSHGGRIWAKSKLNEGTVFYFSLPLKRNKPRFR